MTLRDFHKCVETVPENVEIQFAGMAEPWLNPLATEMVVSAKNFGHPVSIFTTTSGMTPLDVVRLEAFKYRVFCIHLPDKDGLMHLNVDKKYLDVLGECIRVIPNRTFMIVGKMSDEVRAVVGEDVPDFSHGLFSRAGNLRPVPRKTGRLKELPCMRHSVLLPNGDVVICCQDYGVKHCLGNLLKTPYDQLFTGEEYRRVLAGLEDDSQDILCRHCEVAESA